MSVTARFGTRAESGCGQSSPDHALGLAAMSALASGVTPR